MEDVVTTTPVEGANESALAGALERDRERYNGRFALARRKHRSLDGEHFLEHLRDVVGPIVEAVADAHTERVDAVTLALYDLSLDLMGSGYLGRGARNQAIPTLWQLVLPGLAAFMAEQPKRVAASLSNAAYNLSLEPTVDEGAWMKDVAGLATHCTNADDLLAGAQVLAWRHGMAHYRSSAIGVWKELSGPLQRVTLGLEVNLKSALDLENPWQRPGQSFEQAGEQAGRLQIVARLGGFLGFGGAFMTPPSLAATADGLFAYDEHGCWSIHADCFGATLQPAGPRPPEDAHDGSTLDPKSWEHLIKAHPELDAPGQVTATDHTLAIVVGHSHKVILLAEVAASAGVET